MNRREALTLTAALFGGVIVGSQAWLTGCVASKNTVLNFSNKDFQFLDEIGETILPKTDKSAGAKEAHIGEFMKTIVTDCYDSEEQKLFFSGIEEINKRSKKKFSKAFLALSDTLKNFNYWLIWTKRLLSYGKSKPTQTALFFIDETIDYLGLFFIGARHNTSTPLQPCAGRL